MSTNAIYVYEKIQKLKIKMILDGWEIEEKYSNDGWNNCSGYTIWAKRDDWHEKYAHMLTGHSVVFWESCKEITNPTEMLRTVSALRDRVRKAWKEFPTSVPYQNAIGEIWEDTCVTPFANVPKIADLMEETKILSN